MRTPSVPGTKRKGSKGSTVTQRSSSQQLRLRAESGRTGVASGWTGVGVSAVMLSFNFERGLRVTALTESSRRLSSDRKRSKRKLYLARQTMASKRRATSLQYEPPDQEHEDDRRPDVACQREIGADSGPPRRDFGIPAYRPNEASKAAVCDVRNTSTPVVLYAQISGP